MHLPRSWTRSSASRRIRRFADVGQRRADSLRKLIPNLLNTLPRCHSTVRGLRKIWVPILDSSVHRRLGARHGAQLADLLGALPLYYWMNVTVTPLETHPNDPLPTPS